MPSVFVRDELRAAVEGATGGQCTVLYTAQGLPSYFHVLPKFNVEDIDASLGTGTHPAFIINGEEVPQIFIGMFLGLVKNQELLSLPQCIPTKNISLWDAATYANNCGAGFHLMTNAEWAAIALWCQKNGWLPQGNDNWGKCNGAPYQTGVRSDGGSPGTDSGVGSTLTGSGPTQWRHNNQANGIADLAGNMKEWVTGIRLVDGELQVFANNNAANYLNLNNPVQWKAIRFTNGELVAPGTLESVKLDHGSILVQADGDIPEHTTVFDWSSAVNLRDGDIGSDALGAYLQDAFYYIRRGGPAVLMTLGLVPFADVFKMGTVRGRNYGTRIFARGDGHTSLGAGIFSFDALDTPGTVHYFTGARVCKY